MRPRALISLALVVALSPGCRIERDLGRRPDNESRGTLEPRRKLDPETGRVTREWSMLVFEDRAPVKHGPERSYHPSGAPSWSREYHEGRPRGVWRSWYEDGTLRSESFLGDPSRETEMSFWHPNGQLSMRGPARDGSRTGTWTFWYANGQKAEEGQFRSSMKEGRWLAWTKDGRRTFERVYEKNVRVSERLLSEQSAGENPAVTEAAEPPPVPVEDEEDEPRKK